jgi:hypothetical protein
LISSSPAKLPRKLQQYRGGRMFHKALTLVLFGVLFMGTATLTYGTFFDEGFGANVAGIMGMGDGGDDGDHDDD